MDGRDGRPVGVVCRIIRAKTLEEVVWMERDELEASSMSGCLDEVFRCSEQIQEVIEVAERAAENQEGRAGVVELHQEGELLEEVGEDIVWIYGVTGGIANGLLVVWLRRERAQIETHHDTLDPSIHLLQFSAQVGFS